MKKILLIDANSLIHRCFHALPPLSSKNQKPTNALYGLASIILKILKSNPPDAIAALFDRPEPTFRKKIYEQYKIHRPKAPDELVSQIIEAHNLLKSFDIKTFELPGYEADDLIGTFASHFKKEPGSIITILTGDLDALQLVENNKIVVETLKKGVSETVIYNEDAVKTRYENISPRQLPDLKGLVGDASDNIAGVKGIGPKTAISLIQKYGSLEKVVEAAQKSEETALKKIADQKDMALLSKQLATIDTNAPVQLPALSEISYSELPTESVMPYFTELGFQSLIKRLSQNEEEPQTSDAKNEPKKINPKFHPNLSEKILKEIEEPLTPILEEMKNWGIKVDKIALKNFKDDLEIRIASLEKEIYTQAGVIFNVNSPKQLLEVLNKKFGARLNSTAEEKLKTIEEKIPLAKTILDYRELFKLKSTYIEPFTELTRHNDRIHPTFIQLKAATGRIVCENPNLQNIPDSVRHVFIAEEKHKLVSLDYSQVELRILASLSKDPKMLEAFKNNADIHAITASFIFNVPQNQITVQMRRVAKTLNFGVVYGMGARSFAQQSGLSVKDAKKFIDEYFAGFPTIKIWQQQIIDSARQNGYVENLNGRRRLLADIVSFNQRFQSEAQRMAINFPIQSLAADIIKLAMIKTKEKLVEKNLWDKEVKMLLSIHDELIFEIHDSPDLPQIVETIKSVMENVYKLEIPLTVNAKTGQNWGEI